jgi:hypothetical protein
MGDEEGRGKAPHRGSGGAGYLRHCWNRRLLLKRPHVSRVMSASTSSSAFWNKSL